MVVETLVVETLELENWVDAETTVFETQVAQKWKLETLVVPMKKPRNVTAQKVVVGNVFHVNEAAFQVLGMQTRSLCSDSDARGLCRLQRSSGRRQHESGRSQVSFTTHSVDLGYWFFQVKDLFFDAFHSQLHRWR